MATWKENYEQRKARGQCQRCPNQAEPGKTRCASCKAITADYCAGRYDIRVTLGLCVRCGKNKVTRFRECSDCRRGRSKKPQAAVPSSAM